jgi:hypothetical protein
MNWEEFIAALAAMSDGQKFVDAAKSFQESWKGELSKKNGENQTLRTRAKDAEGKLTTLKTNVTKIHDHFGWDENTDLDDALVELSKNKNVSPDLIKKLERLESKMKEEAAKNAKSLEDERGKRHTIIKQDAIRKALAKENAANPDALLDLFAGKVKIEEETDNLFLDDGKGGQLSIDDGIKSWMSENPWAISNKQNPGAGSGGGDGAGGQGSFGQSLAKEIATSSKQSSEAQVNYFG